MFARAGVFTVRRVDRRANGIPYLVIDAGVTGAAGFAPCSRETADASMSAWSTESAGDGWTLVFED